MPAAVLMGGLLVGHSVDGRRGAEREVQARRTREQGLCQALRPTLAAEPLGGRGELRTVLVVVCPGRQTCLMVQIIKSLHSVEPMGKRLLWVLP
jgi:hypothetical protein